MARHKSYRPKASHADARGGIEKQRIMALVAQQAWLEASELCAQLCQRNPSDPEAWFLRGAIHGQRQDFAQAAECCRRAIKLRPDAAIAHYNLGVALQHQDDHNAAADSFREAIRLQPDLAQAHHDLGNAYQALGRIGDAIVCYRKVLTLQPGLAAVHYNLARALCAQGKKSDAIEELQSGLQSDHANVDARFQLAELLAGQRRYTEAADQYHAALRLQPGHLEARVNLGNALQQLNDTAGAIAQYRAALDIRTDIAEVHYNLGNALKTQGLLDEALTSYQQALQLNPDMAMACNNLALVYQEQDRLEEATDLFRRALAINPAQTEPWVNLAKVATEELRLDDAIQALDHAILIDPEEPSPHWDRALAWLMSGDFSKGWPEYELRWQGGQGLIARSFNLPHWQGESLAGKTLLIYAEQGIGDEIMFASCFPDIIARAEHVIIDCAPRLAPLFRRSFPSARIHGGAQNEDPGWLENMPAVDYQIAAGSLPLYLRPSLADFPRHTGYLISDPALRQGWSERYKQLGEGYRIGISWRGGHISQAHKRSTRLDQWQNILQMPGILWINLQYGSVVEEIKAVYDNFGVTIHDWDDADPLQDIDNFAAQIAALDLVISVDNSTVHTAGSLAIPTWVLQRYSPDWRWMTEREDSYWYPSVRQFRQPTHGDWDTVLERVQIGLAKHVSTK